MQKSSFPARSDATDGGYGDVDDLESLYPMADRLRRLAAFDPVAHASTALILRRIMTAVDFSRHCKHKTCQRAKACVTPRVECAWRKLPYLQEYIFPALREAIHAKLAHQKQEKIR